MPSQKCLRNHLASCEISIEMGTEINLLVTIPFLLLGTEGDGLGKNRNGEVNPLTLDIKQDKRGLIASEEAVGKKGRAALQMTAVDLSGKVSKQFNEECIFKSSRSHLCLTYYTLPPS